MDLDAKTKDPPYLRGVGVPNSIYLVFAMKGKMEPQMELQESPPPPIPFLRKWG